MEPKFQTSFIPRTPISTSNASASKVGSEINIVSTIANSIFVLSLLASGAVFGYTKYIQSQVSKYQIKIVEAKSLFESEDNDKILVASNQIKTIKSLLQSHVVVSPLFYLLEKQVLPTVKLMSFGFTKNANGVATVIIDGEGQSYVALAQQFKIFSNDPYFKNIKFTDLGLTDSGTVKVKISADIDKEVLMYGKKLQELSVENINNSNI
ncbi:MAG: hypothetical protein ACYCZW_03280 [Minisyncoccota bacterium]